MALWEGFSDCLDDFSGRLDHHVCVMEYMKTHTDVLQPQKTKRFLSIGPGTGGVDCALLGLLPQVTSYTAVEPDENILNTLKHRLTEVTIGEKNFVQEIMESYLGPSVPSDVILMSHVAYYFADTFQEQICRALSWLNKDGGRIWLLVDQDSIHRLLASEFSIEMKNKDLITAEDVRRHLVDMKANFTKAEIPYTLDVSYPGKSYYGFISVMLNRRATEEEVDKALSVISPCFIPGTKKIKQCQSLFIIQNN